MVLLTVLATFARYSDWSVRADHDERVRDLSGDELIPKPAGSITHAITIRRSALDVWPWLAQMGSGRAGWYANDFIDNGGRPSAERILPEFQNVGVGTVFPALPGVKGVFVVARCEPETALVLAWRSPDGKCLTTWAFVLERIEPSRTRLIVRGRAAPGYSPYGLPPWFAKLTAPLMHAIMERKQLLGIQRRCEAGPWLSAAGKLTSVKRGRATMKRPPLPKTIESFSTSFESVWGAFQKLGEECHGAGPLDDRVRRLVKVGIAAAAQSEGAVHSAVRHAKAAGVPADEIRHVIVLSITTIGFPRAMAAMSWADDILRK